MKAFVIFSVLLALALPANFLIAGAEPVLDTDNHPVRQGHKYYILPSSPGAGGGLTLALNQGRRCPYEIVQIVNETNNGTPVTFSTDDDDHDDDDHNDNDIEDVEVDDDVNIMFVDFQHGTHCPESKVWKFEAGQQHSAAKFVTVGGVEGKEGPKTLSSWFKIQREVGTTHGGRSYKFQYCPDSCDHHDDDDDDRSCRPAVCGDIGVVVYDGRKRLAVNESPFSVVFKKVPTH